MKIWKGRESRLRVDEGSTQPSVLGQRTSMVRTFRDTIAAYYIEEHNTVEPMGFWLADRLPSDASLKRKKTRHPCRPRVKCTEPLLTPAHF